MGKKNKIKKTQLPFRLSQMDSFWVLSAPFLMDELRVMNETVIATYSVATW